MALTSTNWEIVVKKKSFKSSAFKNLNTAVLAYLNDNSKVQALDTAWSDWKMALGNKKPAKTFSTSDRYTTTLDDIETICNPGAAVIPQSGPPSRSRHQSSVAPPLVMGAPHPLFAKVDRDETISASGHAYRNYRQSKGYSCGPTCCLIVLQNYFSNTKFTEDEIRQALSAIPTGKYVPYKGTDMSPLSDFLRRKIGQSNLYQGCSWDNLKASTTRTGGQLYPAIIRIEWHGNGAHFVVVVETLSDYTFMVLDPLKNIAQELSWQQLANYNNGQGSWDGRIVTSW